MSVAGVEVVGDATQAVGRDVRECDRGARPLHEVTREHGAEILAGSGEHGAVAPDLLAGARAQRDVTQRALLVQSA